MTMNDMAILNRCHDEAVKKMGDAAIAIAEAVCEAKLTPEIVQDYKVARIGVESTRRDIEYCLTLELQDILTNTK